MLTVGSLFSGIGGLDLGLERAGMRTKWFVEIDPFCRRVLAKHWSDVPCYEDVRDVGAHNLEPVDLIAGGFPCQDISYAGKGAGLEGARSGLWYEFARIIGEMGPRYVIVENVAALLTRGIGDVLGTLASFGYDAEWSSFPACAVGAPHSRERLFLVAYPGGEQCLPPVFDPHRQEEAGRGDVPRQWRQDRLRFAMGTKAYRRVRTNGAWLHEPQVPRMADGLPIELDAIRTLGNAVVPQVAEWIGRRIMETC